MNTTTQTGTEQFWAEAQAEWDREAGVPGAKQRLYDLLNAAMPGTKVAKKAVRS